MACCSVSQHFPFKPLPLYLQESKKPEVVDLTQKISNNRSQFSYLPPKYHAHFSLRMATIALIIVGIVMGVLALNGNLAALPQHVIHFFKHINWVHAAIGIGAFVVLTCGAIFLIHKVIGQKERITQSALGTLSGDHHWVAACYLRDDTDYYFTGYIDTSTLSDEKSGTAYMYAHKDEQGHTAVSIAITLFTPLHMIAAIAYNVVRVVFIPFFILGRMLYERASTIDPKKRFVLSDIPREVYRSCVRILKAPFYATAIIFAAIYSFFDPLNGRKLGSYLERDWNEGVSRAEGFWSVRGPQPLWQCEGGGKRQDLGRNGFYLAGCWQPIAVLQYEKGEVVSCFSLSRAISPTKGKFYHLITEDILIKRDQSLLEKLHELK